MTDLTLNAGPIGWPTPNTLGDSVAPEYTLDLVRTPDEAATYAQTVAASWGWPAHWVLPCTYGNLVIPAPLPEMFAYEATCGHPGLWFGGHAAAGWPTDPDRYQLVLGWALFALGYVDDTGRQLPGSDLIAAVGTTTPETYAYVHQAMTGALGETAQRETTARYVWDLTPEDTAAAHAYADATIAALAPSLPYLERLRKIGH